MINKERCPDCREMMVPLEHNDCPKAKKQEPLVWPFPAQREKVNIAAVWNLLAEWRPIGWVDHACLECVPHGEIVRPGFRCAYHQIKSAAVLKTTAGGKVL